ncbi:MAG: DNA primase [Halofilum sp. (in: g-proteobacteria)]|nr:DNA primase [Halofilum sp. (in: g-proteobacteria)]
MAGRIPQQFIDDLLARVDIVDVIDARVPLKKQGSNHVACCPFHEEKTPSFSVSPVKQFYYCFGCGASGTALTFLMEHDRLHFVEAVETLAASVGLEVPREGGAAGDSHEPIYAALAAADRFYREQLRASEAAVAYLKQRGISGRTAASFGIGHAPPGWSNLVDHRVAGGDTQTLLAAGLVNRNDAGRVYDRFRNRITFPIRDRRGRTIAFGARVLDDDTPKYLNSPETAVFHKGRELYGLYEARQHRRRLERLLVVEGYMDVVMLAEHGIDYAVATLGTSVSEQHIERLFGAVGEVVFCFDGDEAGRQAAWRALTNTLPLLSGGREARFLFLDEGEDPDSTVRREGQAAFEARLADARPLADFLVERLREGHEDDSIGARDRLAADARPLLARMPAGVYHDLLLERLAREIGLSSDRLRADLGTAAGARRPTPPLRQARGGGVRMTAMRTVIGLLLQMPQLAQRLPDDHPAMRSDQPGGSLLRDLHRRILAAPDITTARLLEAYRDTSEAPHLQRLAAHEFATDPQQDRDAALAREFDDALAGLAKKHRRQRLGALSAAARERELSAEEKQELRQLRVDEPAPGRG